MTATKVRKFLVRYSADATIQLEGVLRFEMPLNVTVNVSDRIERDENQVPIRYGLELEAICDAEDWEKATALTYGMVSGLAGLISFCHSSAVSNCVPELVLDISPDIEERELVAILQLPSRIRPSRKYRREEFSRFWRCLDATAKDLKPRIHRASRWYSKALLEEDVLDRFTNLWVGLEVLNEPLKRKYRLSENKSIRNCSKCGEPVVLIPASAGLKYLFVEICKTPFPDWKKVITVRKGLLHGFGSLDKITVDAHQLVPLLQKALLTGILDLVEMPEEERSGLIRDPLMLQQKASAKVHINIWNLSVDKVISGETVIRPVITSTETRRSESGRGTISETGTITVRIPGHEGSYRGKSIEVFLGKDPEDHEASLSIKTV